MKRFVSLALAALLLVPAVASAQKPVAVGQVLSATFTVAAIDKGTRVVTLKDKDGVTQEIVCGPDVQRFDTLKVGDKVTFQYHESLISAISRPGSTSKPAAVAAMTRNATGGAIAQQMTATVTLEAIDPKVPSVTVKTAGGERMSFHVEDAKNLEGYKVGDKVDVTYTQALAISVAPAK